jgi:hypothetical protein
MKKLISEIGYQFIVDTLLSLKGINSEDADVKVC